MLRIIFWTTDHRPETCHGSWERWTCRRSVPVPCWPLEGGALAVEGGTFPLLVAGLWFKYRVGHFQKIALELSGLIVNKHLIECSNFR